LQPERSDPAHRRPNRTSALLCALLLLLVGLLPGSGGPRPHLGDDAADGLAFLGGEDNTQLATLQKPLQLRADLSATKGDPPCPPAPLRAAKPAEAAVRAPATPATLRLPPLAPAISPRQPTGPPLSTV